MTDIYKEFTVSVVKHQPSYKEQEFRRVVRAGIVTAYEKLRKDTEDGVVPEERLVRKSLAVSNHYISKLAGEDVDEDSPIYFALKIYVQNIMQEVINSLNRKSKAVAAAYPNINSQYSVDRGKGIVWVPVEQLTIDELRARATLFRLQIHGLEVHADALDRYADDREAVGRG